MYVRYLRFRFLKWPWSSRETRKKAKLVEVPGDSKMFAYWKPSGVRCLPGWWLTYPTEEYEFVNWDDDSKYIGP